MLHEIPFQLHGVVDESDHEFRIPVGSLSIAAFRASRERPSVFREEVKGMERQRKRVIMGM